ncbi:DUF397 domain-containing protein [Sphaerisporangium rubeum]|uniref:DUF397 domain-containing protein n=1 Tax=Sphaerisporangium rubeum TaxID=321317 RepID=UPI001C875720|nr:DUF397 domain-containing protein [Sphaerisporangium rubeum]
MIGELSWRKSSHSGSNGGTCVEVARIGDDFAVRDSKKTERGHLTISAAEFRTFLIGVKDARA